MRWSRRLRRSILGLDADNELTDEDLAAEDVNGELAALDTAAWSRLRVAGLDLVVLVAVELHVMQEPDALFSVRIGARLPDRELSDGLPDWLLDPLLDRLGTTISDRNVAPIALRYASLCRTSMIPNAVSARYSPKGQPSPPAVGGTSLMPSIMYAEQYPTSGFLLVGQDRARRAGRGELHEPVLVPADVGVQPKHGIEGLGPVHVGDRDDDYLEVGVHGPVMPGSGGNPNTASRPGFPNEVTWLIPRPVTVSTQTP